MQHAFNVPRPLLVIPTRFESIHFQIKDLIRTPRARHLFRLVNRRSGSNARNGVLSGLATTRPESGSVCFCRRLSLASHRRRDPFTR